MNRLAAILLGTLLLSACASSGRSPADVAVYDLGPPVAAPAGAAAAHAGLALEVRLPVWLDSTALVYRLAYAEPQRVHQYSRARWAGQPAQLLQQRLRQALAIAPGGAPCTLRVELDDFSQVFDSAASSRVELRGEAMLYGKGRTLLARQTLRVEQPAPTADAGGGVRALAAAAESAAAALEPWLRQQDLAQCRPRG